MLMREVFLIVLALCWITFAVIQDLKKREIANWLNFSLIIFALGFRFFVSLFGDNGFSFFYQGLIGLGTFFAIGNLFYYGKIFAGGDAKLMIALGTVLPIFNSFLDNLYFFLGFLLFFMVSGAIYGVVFGVVLAVRHRKDFSKEFLNQMRKGKKIFYILTFMGIVLLFLAFMNNLLFYLALLLLISPYIYFSAKSIDESCMIKEIETKFLTEGDWLYHDIRVGKTTIESKWGGLDKKELSILKKQNRKVKIREGIPFGPVFLIGYAALLISYFFFGGIKGFF